MKRNQTILLFAIATLLTCVPLKAQTDSIYTTYGYQKRISLTFLGPNLIYSLNYSNIFKELKKGSLIGQLNGTYLSDFFVGESW